jgi:hypothetical protein
LGFVGVGVASPLIVVKFRLVTAERNMPSRQAVPAVFMQLGMMRMAVGRAGKIKTRTALLLLAKTRSRTQDMQVSTQQVQVKHTMQRHVKMKSTE